MSTCFANRMPTYLYAIILLWLGALMITCSYVQRLWWLHAHLHWYSQVWYPHTSADTMIVKCLYSWRHKWSCYRMYVHSNSLTIVLECWGDYEIKGMCTWVLKCSYACMFSWSHSCLLSWSNACMYSCFVDNMLTFVLALIITFSHVYMLWLSHAPIFTCFNGHMLLCSHDFMIVCSYVYMIWQSHA